MAELLYCSKCEKYTLDKICNTCKGTTIVKKPARFSPQDHYGRYRRELKKLEKNG